MPTILKRDMVIGDPATLSYDSPADTRYFQVDCKDVNVAGARRFAACAEVVASGINLYDYHPQADAARLGLRVTSLVASPFNGSDLIYLVAVRYTQAIADIPGGHWRIRQDGTCKIEECGYDAAGKKILAKFYPSGMPGMTFEKWSSSSLLQYLWTQGMTQPKPVNYTYFVYTRRFILDFADPRWPGNVDGERPTPNINVIQQWPSYFCGCACWNRSGIHPGTFFLLDGQTNENGQKGQYENNTMYVHSIQLSSRDGWCTADVAVTLIYTGGNIMTSDGKLHAIGNDRGVTFTYNGYTPFAVGVEGGTIPDDFLKPNNVGIPAGNFDYSPDGVTMNGGLSKHHMLAQVDPWLAYDTGLELGVVDRGPADGGSTKPLP